MSTVVEFSEEEHDALYAASKRALETFSVENHRHYRERKHLLAAVRKLEGVKMVPIEHRFKA